VGTGASPVQAERNGTEQSATDPTPEVAITAALPVFKLLSA